MVEVLTYRGRTVPKDFTELGTLGNFLNHGNSGLSIPELLVPGIHCNSNGHSGTHGVNASVITQKVKPGNRIQIINAGHAPH